MRKLLGGYLDELGYTNVELVSSGLEVVWAFKRRAYKVAFLDIEMPSMDGLEALREVLAIAPDTHVVIVSSHGTLDNVTTAIQMGAKGFLVKPYSKHKLMDVMRAYHDSGAVR